MKDRLESMLQKLIDVRNVLICIKVGLRVTFEE